MEIALLTIIVYTLGSLLFISILTVDEKPMDPNTKFGQYYVGFQFLMVIICVILLSIIGLGRYF